MRVLVKGAGVAGLATAHELAARGAAVTVSETAPAPGAGASWMAGGMLAPWCERESAEEAVVTLGKSAANWWEAALPGIVARHGTLVVAAPRDTAELGRFAARTRGFERVDEAAIGALEPDLAGRFRAGLYFAGEAHLDPRAALYRLHEELSARGVTFRSGAAEAAGFDRLIDCTGMAAAGRIGGLRGVRGEMLYLETPEVRLSRPVRLIHPRHPIYVVPRGEARFMVGATMIESGERGPITARSTMELLNAAYALNPAFGEARIVETGSGVRPAFADNLPRVVESGGTLFVNGLYRHGFLLAPAMAREAAERIFAGKETEHAVHRQRQSA